MPLQTSRIFDYYVEFIHSVLNLAIITELLPTITLLAILIALFSTLGASNTLVILYAILIMMIVSLGVALLITTISAISSSIPVQ